jgi:hypothetical protein
MEMNWRGINLGIGENGENISPGWIHSLPIKRGLPLSSAMSILIVQVNLANNVPPSPHSTFGELIF